MYKRAKWLQNGNKIVTNCCGFVIFYVIMAVTEKIAVFHDGRKSNLKGVERALCPFLLLTEKAVQHSEVDALGLVHNGGLLYKYIDCLGRMPV